MRIKKGFTLAEILIVLMVIGVIATMTIPSLMRGVTEQQWKTGYNKAYNTISNLAAMERVSGNLSGTAGTGNATSSQRFFESMVGTLNVREYATNGVNSGTIVTTQNYHPAISYTSASTGAATNTGEDSVEFSSTAESLSWVITEDNLAYAVIQGANGTGDRCPTKQEILGDTTNTVPAACTYVVVDVNGLSAGPNILEVQNDLTSSTALQPLTGDRYYIFIGLDGATSGNKAKTVTGRITAGLK